jgi:hypothetical protein
VWHLSSESGVEDEQMIGEQKFTHAIGLMQGVDEGI